MTEEGTTTEAYHMTTPFDNVRANCVRLEEIEETADFNLCSHYHTPTTKTKVTLPDGSRQCIAHDLTTKENLGIGKLVGQLYILDHTSFIVPKKIHDVSVFVSCEQLNSVLPSIEDSSAVLWHKHLGHASVEAIHCISSIKVKDFSSFSPCDEPHNYKQAVERPEWVEAMNQELLALENNDTWVVAPLPPGKKAIDCKRVYKLKLKDDGSTERSFSWPLQQLDINNAFLHGYLDGEIYMRPPEGYSIASGMVCRLKHSLYGLKQASRQWYQKFTLKLLVYGFSQSAYDHCLFLKGSGTDFIALIIYVDDVLLTGPSLKLLADVNAYLDAFFTIKDLGAARFFLGLQIAWSKEGLSLHQGKYIHDIISDAGLLDAKSTTMPLPASIKLSQEGGAALTDPEPYRRLVGRLLYLGFTRPDISHSVQQLSQLIQHPCETHWRAALHVIQYLKGTSTTGLFFHPPTPCNYRHFVTLIGPLAVTPIGP
ncbi:UNVERIFIED_CONTAM: Retrovirus-related Pol polyprotein from transposon RE2 [Sesamum latifolium]|uniref:Retrovirus-related Pol polyprotein from transposon RE2 n=1 Tax=Sesamum latifolium TaxID=2727402 RepID=A0AAW2WUW2_9LAMI